MRSITTYGMRLAATVALALLAKSAPAALVVQGDLLVNLDAQSLPDGTISSWTNAGSLGGTFNNVGGGTTTVTTYAGIRGVQFENGVMAGPVSPDSICFKGPVSIEVWTNNPVIDWEETLVAWAKRGGPEGSNMAFNYGNSGDFGAVGHWGWPDLGWNGTPAANVWHHLVYTFDGTTDRVYADGVKKSEENISSVVNVYNGQTILLGGQHGGGGNVETGWLRGYIAAVRMETGVLSDADVLANFNAGITATLASDMTWIGATGDNNWGNSANWSPAGVPDSTDKIAVVGATAGAPAALDLGSKDRTLAGLTLNGTVNTTLNSSNNHSLVLPELKVLGGQHIINTAVALNRNAAITVSGTTGSLTLKGVVSGDGKALSKSGDGLLVLANAGNSYSGGTTINAGTVQVASLTSLGSGSLALGGTATQGTLSYTGGNASYTGPVTLNAGGGQIVNSGGTLTINGNLGGGGGLTKAGTGTLVINGIGAYSGPTNINAGTLRMVPSTAPSDALIHYTFDSVNGNQVTNLGTGGAALNGTLRNGTTVAGQVGGAISFAGGNSGVITNSSATIGNAFTLATWVSATSANPGTWQRIITNNYGESAYLGTNDGNPNQYLTIVRGQFDFAGVNQDTSGVWHHLVQVWDGTNQSFYIDGTLVPGYPRNHAGINSSRTDKFGFGCNSWDWTESWKGAMDDAYVFNRALSPAEVSALYAYTGGGFGVPSTSPVTVALNATLDLSGASGTIGPLAGQGHVTLGGGNLTVNSVSDSAFSGNIAGPGSLTKSGGHALTLTSSAHTYDGATTVNAGKLVIGGAGSINSSSGITVNGSGAVLQYDSSTALTRPVSFGPNGGKFLYNENASGYSGGPLGVDNLATVGGAGKLGAVSVASGGHVAPGADPSVPGTLRVASLDLASGSILDFNFGAGSNDQIAVGGVLTIDGGAFNAYDTAGNPFGAIGTYNLINYSTLAGSVPVSNFSVLNAVPGSLYAFSTSGNYVVMTISQGPVWIGGGSDANWSTSANWVSVRPSPGNTIVFQAAAGGASNNDMANGPYASLEFTASAGEFTLTGSGPGSSVTLNGDIYGDIIVNRSASTQTIDLPVTLGADGAINPATGSVIVSSAVDNNGHVLTVKAPQPVTLNGAMAGSGGLTMNAGAKLNLGNDSAVSGTLTINGGTIDNTKGSASTLTNNPAQTWGGNFTFAGTNDLNMGAGPVALAANTEVTVNNNANLTVGGAIAGPSNNITKRGNGTLTLSGEGSSLNYLSAYGSGSKVVIGGSTSVANGMQDIRDGATFRIENGDFTVPWISMRETNAVYWVVAGGSLTTGEINMGFNQGTASLLASGGTIHAGDLNAGTANASSIYIGVKGDAEATFQNARIAQSNYYGDGHGSYAVLEMATTKSMTVNDALIVGDYLDSSGNGNTTRPGYLNGQVYQTSGAVSVGNNVVLANTQNQSRDELVGTYNLSGGSLSAQKIRTGSGTGFFNFHGGTLVYNGAGPQTDFMTFNDKSSVHIYEGATIDTGSQDVTINQPLLAPSDDGVAGISTAGLTGQAYVAPPWVYVSGGGGSGATAIATLDASGHVSEIDVTNPGSGYTSTPTVQLIRTYDNIQTAAAGNVTMAPNSDYAGGLTKTGSGVLTLGAANTYAGNTVISAGVLKVGNDLAIPTGAGKGKVVLNGGVTEAGTLDLSGHGVSINGLEGAKGDILGQVLNNGFVASTLSVGDADADSAFAGTLGDGLGGLALAKIGTGTLTLSGPNSYLGGTTVNGGTLRIASVGALPAGGALTIEAGGTVVLVSGLSAAAGTGGGRAAQPVPEPSALALLAAAAAGGAWLAWRSSRSRAK